MPKVGHIEDGYYFKGGKASEKANWVPVPEVGATEGGYVYKGGNPSDRKNWEPEEESGFLDKLDIYTGAAPLRRSIGRMQEGEFGKAITGFLDPFTGEGGVKAPGGSEVMAKAGLSTEAKPGGSISYWTGKVIPRSAPADVAGFGFEMVADPTALLGTGLLKKAGKAIDKPIKQVGGIIEESLGLRKGAEELDKAGKKLGVEIPAEMKMEGDLLRKVQNSLEQSPMVAGALARKRMKPIRDAVQSGSEEALKNASDMSKYEVGEGIKKDIISEYAERMGVSEAQYAELEELGRGVPVSQSSRTRVANNLLRIDEVRVRPNSPASNVVKSVANDLRNIQSANDLKILRTSIGRQADAAAKAGDPSANVLFQVYDRLSSLRNNTLKRALISGQSKSAAKESLEALAQVDEGYRQLMTDVGFLKEGLGKGKKRMTPGAFVNFVEEMPSEQLVDKLWQRKNIKYMKEFAEKYPESFEQLKSAKLAEVYQKSLFKGQVSPKKLANQVRKLEPEYKELLYGDIGAKAIDDIANILDAMPDKVGPSGTPQGIEFMMVLSPHSWALELGRLAQYGMLGAVNYGEDFAKALKKANFQKYLPKAAITEAPGFLGRGLLPRQEREEEKGLFGPQGEFRK